MEEEQQRQQKPIEWKEKVISTEDVTVIKNCYCPNCECDNGAITTFLPTKIPFFKEILITNLICDTCNYKNSEISFGGEIQKYGERITLIISSNNKNDLNRHIIKSDTATLYIPEIQFEIPCNTQKGIITTIEGILNTAVNNLQQSQSERLRLGDLDNFYRCKHVIDSIQQFIGSDNNNDDDDNDNQDLDGEKEQTLPFKTIILDDPAGNSYIENPFAPKSDPNLQSEKYCRTVKQDAALGLQPSILPQQAKNPIFGNIHDDIAAKDGTKTASLQPAAERRHTIETDLTNSIGRQEVIKFPTNCSSCHEPSETNMCIIDIPHFKEVIIMSMICDNCGYKSNEIKGGSGISKYGTKITLSVSNEEDLTREVLKSDTAGIMIPELELELEEGGLDGVYTTIEGIINKIHDRLQLANPFSIGDSATCQHRCNDGKTFSPPSNNHIRFQSLLTKLKEMANGNHFPFTIIISDPLSNSFIGPIHNDVITLSKQAELDGNTKCYDEYIDPSIRIEQFVRTNVQNDILGLNDIKTENYQKDNNNNNKYFGTDTMEDNGSSKPRRHITRVGPDHPQHYYTTTTEKDSNNINENIDNNNNNNTTQYNK